MTKLTGEQLAESFDAMSLLIGNLAKQASHVAHARRVLYEAYLAEGFTEAQALELCKVLLIQ